MDSKANNADNKKATPKFITADHIPTDFGIRCLTSATYKLHSAVVNLQQLIVALVEESQTYPPTADDNISLNQGLKIVLFIDALANQLKLNNVTIEELGRFSTVIQLGSTINGDNQ